ncbi:MAG: gluconokinase [Saprospiraceae bacterium]
MLLGLDIGTTSTKACAFDADGKLCHEVLRPYELEQAAAGAATQDADAVVVAATEALAELLKKVGDRAASLGISTAMHGLIALDDAGGCLTPLITWADTRAATAIADWPEADRLRLHAATGTPVHAMSPLAKIAWLRAEQPGVYRRAARYVGIKEYFLLQTAADGPAARPPVDYQLASATGLFNIKEKIWHAPALERVGISEDQLPRPMDPRYRIGWSDDFLARTGLPADLPTAIGGSDGCLANLGSGLSGPGAAAITIGTSGAVRMTQRGPATDPTGALFTYCLLDDTYVTGGATNNGGKVLEWLADLLQEKPDVGRLIESAAKVPAGAEGLGFLPYLNGERAPIYDASATAAFTGLRGSHRREHLVRAALEGVTGNLVTILRLLEDHIQPVDHLLASGGFTRSPFWVKLLEDMSGREVRIADTPQASAYGAALVGAMVRE